MSTHSASLMNLPARRTLPNRRYPRGAYFILAGYLLERMVYYGLFGGAVFYMQRVLHFSASESSTIKAVLEGIIYLAPVVGAAIADSWLGKFRLVFMMCCGYVVGTIIYTLSSASPLMSTVTITKVIGIGGLIVFGLCTGLMKAVYSSLGPDQFPFPDQRPMQQRFFYFFYWMINAGAFLGQLLTAQLRETVQCFGSDCFLLPYSMLVGVMVLSTIIFYSGKGHYIEALPDPMLLRCARCVARATRMSFDHDKENVDHWLDRASIKSKREQALKLPGSHTMTSPPALVADVKKTLRVILLFCTFPLFWALFYQTSTGMIFQAKRLYDRIGTYRVPPELTSSINPLLILLLIPFFDFVVYPFLNRLNLLTLTTSRMAVGMLFAVAAFIVYGCLNLQLEQTILGNGQAYLQFYNTRPCQVIVEPWLDNDVQWIIPPNGQILETITLPAYTNSTLFQPKISKDCGFSRVELKQIDITLVQKFHTAVILENASFTQLSPTLHYIKDKDAEAKIRVTSLSDVHQSSVKHFILNYKDMNVSISVTHGTSHFTALPPEPYKMIDVQLDKVLGEIDIRQDGVYDILVSADHNSTLTFVLTAPSDVHVLWTLPQYIILTVGEILFSVSGMDFAYTEAPTAMKSVLQAVNLFTITLGLWMFAILTSVSEATGWFLYKPSREAFSYAALMLIDTMIFIVLTKRYYAKQKEEALRASEVILNIKQPNGIENIAFVEERI